MPSSVNALNACTLTTFTPDATAGSAPQITTTVGTGSFCVKVYDSGNLTTTSTFTIDVVHS